MSFSLSTSWNYADHTSGSAIIDEICSAGFGTVELNFALTKGIVEDILKIKESGGIAVSSLHNMCPLPDEIDPAKASPDYYSLCSPSKEERGMAVNAAKTTIDYANKFGAKAIVLHCGRVPIKDRTRELASFIEDTLKADTLREAMMRERSEQRGLCIENLMSSLNDLIPHALAKGVAIGLENRYYYREIPVIDEFEILFRKFPKPPIYYWHDAGHAEVFQRLGLGSHLEMLRRFSNRLLGVHLHDIIGPINDHKAPGCGTFDFSILKPYMSETTIKVIEAHCPATVTELREGVKYLDKALNLR